MAIQKCEMCGGTLEVEDNGSFAVCTYCGTRQALPESGSSPEAVKADALRIENEKRKTAEAKAKAEESRLKAESKRLEYEHIAEKKRAEKSERSKKRRDVIGKFFLVILALSLLSILTFRLIIPTVRYNGAVKELEAENYEEAYITFKSLGNFKDSKDHADKLLKDYPSVAQVGDIILLGQYEQDNKTSNGKEAIEWKVLDKDSEGNMFVISLYALDCRSYHSTVAEVTWETSDIRKWLNQDFYNMAFSVADKSKIRTTSIQNRDNPDYNTDGGNDTNDKLYLLSIDEAITYLPKSVDRLCIATKYAESQGSQLEGITRNCRWWLRSPGTNTYKAAAVKVDGFILNMGAPASLEKRSIRPAMWIEL